MLALLAAAFFCALSVRLSNTSPPPETSWPEGMPDDWANSRIDLSALQAPNTEYVCPMDRDVSSKQPGFCPRCRMKLVAATPVDPQAHPYPVELTTRPRVTKPNEPIQLLFAVQDPQTSEPVRNYELVHERIYHLFVVGQDLGFFLHTHPEPQPDGTMRLDVKVPAEGMYRILSDFYPKGGTPQLVTNTLLVGAAESLPQRSAQLRADLAPQRGENIGMELTSFPSRPKAHAKTQISLRVTPNDGIEPYLGVMAHVLAASEDLVDMMHSHPLQVTDHGSSNKELLFEMTFPRTGVYRIWVQTQRKGIVNTVAFNIPIAG